MSSFESNKNAKAAAYTTLCVGILALLFFIVSWTTPPAKEVNQDEGLEVNLGNSETGIGEIQPLLPDPPALAEEEVQTTPPPLSKTVIAEKEIETNDKDKDAPEVVSIKSKAKVILPPTKAKENLPPTNKPITPPNPTPPIERTPIETPPAPPKAKILYTGAKNNVKGGNNGDSFQKSNGQGISSGKGDQGKPNGDPNSDSYSGNGGNGNGGISVTGPLKGRKINRYPSFEDDFNENAKIAIDITVDNRGNVITTNFQQKGSTTANSVMKSIALQKARQLKFSADETGSSEQIGTVTFVFRIKN